MSRDEVHAAVASFSERYVTDWNAWLNVRATQKAALFGEILRRWQATRPRVMRRTKAERLHQPPFLDDLIEEADRRVRRLGDLAIGPGWSPTADQESALVGLWATFEDLAIPAPASSVGISKAVLLLTNGRIGPALDSNVQRSLGIPRPTTAREWITLLGAVASDVAAFEAKNGRLASCVPTRHGQLAVGRLYDMALGPR